jgi:hypothetical protein
MVSRGASRTVRNFTLLQLRSVLPCWRNIIIAFDVNCRNADFYLVVHLIQARFRPDLIGVALPAKARAADRRKSHDRETANA